MSHYDFIGDIHGHASKLKQLLRELGYSRHDGVFRHPNRMAFFVGDYIDRGPEIPEVIDIVRSMVEAGSAIALMGNHEFNAICFNTPHTSGDFLRKHNIKHFLQHKETLEQFKGNQQGYNAAINWFKTLPLYFETEFFRAVHATWDPQYLSTLNQYFDQAQLKDELLHEATDRSSQLYLAVDVTLKGKEARLPGDYFFHDKDGNKRRNVRLKWWEDPVGKTFGDLAMNEVSEVSTVPVEKLDGNSYDDSEVPVFFGHYWLQGRPDLYRHNVCCLDYSVAKDGFLVAYRFDGEAKLDSSKLLWV